MLLLPRMSQLTKKTSQFRLIPDTFLLTNPIGNIAPLKTMFRTSLPSAPCWTVSLSWQLTRSSATEIKVILLRFLSVIPNQIGELIFGIPEKTCPNWSLTHWTDISLTNRIKESSGQFTFPFNRKKLNHWSSSHV